MFRFIITLVLINTCYHSLGSPITTHIILHPLGKSLKTLADRCENQLLVSQINNYIPECDISVFDVKQMQCLIFYDISTQLCDANSKLVLQNDFTNDLKTAINVNSMCENAQNWKFTDLLDFPQYKAKAETIFKNQVKCQKVCDVSDLISEDSNIFCKYYKWGSEIVKTQPSTPLSVEKSTDSKILAAIPDQPISTELKASRTFSNTVTGIPTVKTHNINSDNTLLKKLSNPISDATFTNVERPEEDQNFKVVQTSSLNTAISGGEINQYQQKDPNQTVSEPSAVDISHSVGQSAVVQKPDIPVKTEIEKAMLDEEEEPPKRVDVEKEDQILNSQNKDIKDQVVDDLGDDPDTEEEDKQDLADDSEISIGKGDSLKMEEKVNEKVENKNIPIRTTYTAERSQEEFIPKIPQEDFQEDDDHFFSFFLTAVIIVVLLYVLYHNKSKFTKVILGLIVEGRQSGRRRNSRGHAYRRLDTLEQAMSSNSPAPPSKIIY